MFLFFNAHNKSHKSHLKSNSVQARGPDATNRWTVKLFWCDVKRFNTFCLTLNVHVISFTSNMRSIQLRTSLIDYICYLLAMTMKRTEKISNDIFLNMLCIFSLSAIFQFHFFSFKLKYIDSISAKQPMPLKMKSFFLPLWTKYWKMEYGFLRYPIVEPTNLMSICF